MNKQTNNANTYATYSTDYARTPSYYHGSGEFAFPVFASETWRSSELKVHTVAFLRLLQNFANNSAMLAPNNFRLNSVAPHFPLTENTELEFQFSEMKIPQPQSTALEIYPIPLFLSLGILKKYPGPCFELPLLPELYFSMDKIVATNNKWLEINLLPKQILRSRKQMFSMKTELQDIIPLSPVSLTCFMYRNPAFSPDARIPNTPFIAPMQNNIMPYVYSRISNTTKELISSSRCTTIQCLLSKRTQIEAIFSALNITDQMCYGVQWDNSSQRAAAWVHMKSLFFIDNGTFKPCFQTLYLQNGSSHDREDPAALWYIILRKINDPQQITILKRKLTGDVTSLTWSGLSFRDTFARLLDLSVMHLQLTSLHLDDAMLIDKIVVLMRTLDLSSVSPRLQTSVQIHFESVIHQPHSSCSLLENLINYAESEDILLRHPLHPPVHAPTGVALHATLRDPLSSPEPSTFARCVPPSHTLSAIGIPPNQDDMSTDVRHNQWSQSRDHYSSPQNQSSSFTLGQFNNAPHVVPPAAPQRHNTSQSDYRQHDDRGRSPSNDRNPNNRDRFDKNNRSRNRDDQDGHYGPKRDQHNPYNSRERDRSRSSDRLPYSTSSAPQPPALKLPIPSPASQPSSMPDDQSSVDIITSPDGQFVTSIETFGRDGLLIASTPMSPPLHKSCFNPAMFPSIRNKSLMMHRSYVSRIDFENLAIWDTGCCGTSVSSSIQNVSNLRTTTTGEVVTESATGQQVIFPQVGTLLASPIAISSDIKSPTLLNMVGIARDGGIAYLADQHGLIAVDSKTFVNLLSLLRPSDILYHTRTLDGLYTIDLNHADAAKLITHTAAFAASASTASKQSAPNWPHCFTILDPCINHERPVSTASTRHSSRHSTSTVIRHSSF